MKTRQRKIQRMAIHLMIDDFGDFSTNDGTSKGDENATKENTENGDTFDDDDFGDFSTNDNAGNEDEWGKFEDDKTGPQEALLRNQ